MKYNIQAHSLITPTFYTSARLRYFWPSLTIKAQYVGVKRIGAIKVLMFHKSRTLYFRIVPWICRIILFDVRKKPAIVIATYVFLSPSSIFFFFFFGIENDNFVLPVVSKCCSRSLSRSPDDNTNELRHSYYPGFKTAWKAS